MRLALSEMSKCFTVETAFSHLDYNSLTPRLVLNPRPDKYILENHEVIKHVYCRKYFQTMNYVCYYSLKL